MAFNRYDGVALTDKSEAALERLGILTGFTETDLINRAIQLYAFITEEIALDKKFGIVDTDGTVEAFKLL